MCRLLEMRVCCFHVEISLTSFVFKTLERALDGDDFRTTMMRMPVSKSQHAHLKSRSTETPLHEVISTAEHLLQYKQYIQLPSWT